MRSGHKQTGRKLIDGTNLKSISDYERYCIMRNCDLEEAAPLLITNFGGCSECS